MGMRWRARGRRDKRMKMPANSCIGNLDRTGMSKSGVMCSGNMGREEACS